MPYQAERRSENAASQLPQGHPDPQQARCVSFVFTPLSLARSRPASRTRKSLPFHYVLVADSHSCSRLHHIYAWSDGKKLVCVSKESLEPEETETEKSERESDEKSFEDLCKAIKDALGDKVEKVVISNRITDSPCVLVTGQFGWSSDIECIIKAQALRDSSMSSYMAPKKTLKLNPHNAIVKELKKKIAEDKSGKSVRDLTYLMFETALLTSGFVLEEPTSFAKRIYRMISLDLDVDEDEEITDAPSSSADALPPLEAAAAAP